MKLIATRHAETNYNLEDIVNYEPSVDVHLTDNGVKQAEALANQLKDFKFDAIYTSRLKRTKRTRKFLHYLKEHHRSGDVILAATSSHLIKQLRLLNNEITMQDLLTAPAKHATYYTFELEEMK